MTGVSFGGTPVRKLTVPYGIPVAVSKACVEDEHGVREDYEDGVPGNRRVATSNAIVKSSPS